MIGSFARLISSQHRISGNCIHEQLLHPARKLAHTGTSCCKYVAVDVVVAVVAAAVVTAVVVSVVVSVAVAAAVAVAVA
eukprot:6377357-Pyramimonas_sp.AAC.1